MGRGRPPARGACVVARGARGLVGLGDTGPGAFRAHGRGRAWDTHPAPLCLKDQPGPRRKGQIFSGEPCALLPCPTFQPLPSSLASGPGTPPSTPLPPTHFQTCPLCSQAPGDPHPSSSPTPSP